MKIFLLLSIFLLGPTNSFAAKKTKKSKKRSAYQICRLANLRHTKLALRILDLEKMALPTDKKSKKSLREEKKRNRRVDKIIKRMAKENKRIEKYKCKRFNEKFKKDRVMIKYGKKLKQALSNLK